MSPEKPIAEDISSVRFEIVESVIFQDLEDEMVLLNLVDQQYYGLDDVGTIIWKSISAGQDVAAAARQVCGCFEVEEQTAARDVCDFVAALLSAGLLKRVGC